MLGGRARLTALAAAVLASAGGATAARAQGAGSVAFADEKISVSWRELTTGRQVQLCNGADRDAERLGIALTGFSFTHAGAAVPPARVLSVAGPRAKLAAGTCGALTIRAAAGAAIDAGSYDGAILVAAPGGGTARLDVTVSGPGRAQAVPAGVSDEETLDVHNSSPWDRHGSADLLLEPPKAGETRPTFADACSRPGAKGCPFLGTLFHGNDRIEVRAAGAVSVKGRVMRLPVRLTTSGHAVGDYEGRLDLPGATAPVKVKATVKDAWWCAVIALLVGALLALLLQLWTGRWRPKLDVERRTDEIDGCYAAKPYVRDHPRITVDHERTHGYAEDVRTAMRRYANTTLLIDTSSDAYKQVDAALTLAGADLAVLEDGLAASLTSLLTEIEETRRLLVAKQVADLPALLARAGAPLRPGALGVGDATERDKQANELTDLLPVWRMLAARVFEQATWIKALAAAETWQLATDEDAELLAGAGATLYGVRRELFVALDAAELRRIDTSTRLDETFGVLDYLGEKYGVGMPALDVAPDTFDADLTRVNYLAARGRPPDLLAVTARAWHLIARSAKAVRLPSPRVRLLFFDIAALVFGVIVSVVAGLGAFYFGNSFGTIEDYLTVIVIGVAAQVVAKAVLDGTSALVHDVAPVSETTPATAATVPAAPAAVTEA